MGYPMTWRRIINRNALAKGDYTDSGDHGINVNLDNPGIKDRHLPEEQRIRDLQSHLAPEYVKMIRSNESRWMGLLGDLRRLEADVQDERLICQGIAERTGVDADTVAAVLKEFMSF